MVWRSVADLSLLAENTRAIRNSPNLTVKKETKSFAICELPKSNLASSNANKALEEAASLLSKSGHKVKNYHYQKI
ncbi:MAG: hypothetical protein CM15mP85_30090 [Rhodobacterales bacterium]|nr:MAG: hypothetical protein CM15mP85_30090 [Rhodobacterales bacterium]